MVSELQSITFRLDFNEHYHVKVESSAKAKLEQDWVSRGFTPEGDHHDGEDNDDDT